MHNEETQKCSPRLKTLIRLYFLLALFPVVGVGAAAGLLTTENNTTPMTTKAAMAPMIHHFRPFRAA